MKELKTLKEICWANKIGLREFSILKKEAIKWVKFDIIELRKQGMVAKNIIAWDLLREWMKRLNITEDDLK